MMDKRQWKDLSVFGAPPAFRQPLCVGRPNVGDRERLMARIADLLDRRWLTNDGPYVQEFERCVERLLGVRHCIAVGSGTVGLEIAARAAGLSGEVIVPALTFIATPHALRWQGLQPAFCDVDAESHTIDPQQVEALITPRTSGILGVHLWGRICDVEALERIARRHRLRLLYDAAHAFACSHRGMMVGNFGDAEVFSFHATKFINTLEGGAVVTNDDDLAHRARAMRNFGLTTGEVTAGVGINGKMNEVSAAMGLTLLEGLDELMALNRRNYRAYHRELHHLPGINLISYDVAERCNYQYVVLEIEQVEAGIGRDELLEALRLENILARRYFYPGCHRMSPYCDDVGCVRRSLPQTERVVGQTLALPTGTAVTPQIVRDVCLLIRWIVAHGHEVRRALRRRVMSEGFYVSIDPLVQSSKQPSCDTCPMHTTVCTLPDLHLIVREGGL